MPISIEGERLMPLREVPKSRLIPGRRGGSRLNVRTVFRWALDGLRGIRLESIMIGGTRCTSVEALVRFFHAIDRPQERPKAERDEIKRPIATRRLAVLDRELDQMGL